MTPYTLKQIETPRLIIRPVQLGDEIPLNIAINHSLKHLQRWEPWAKDPSIDATRGFIQRGVFAWLSQTIIDFPMVVIHKADQKIIGASGYNDRSDIHQGLYEIGYWCDIDYQGKGLITECANALTRFAFDGLKATKVIIQMMQKNIKSRAVAERLGFTHEGIKDRDPLDCLSENPEKNDIFIARNSNSLPDLNINWTHHTEENTTAQMIAWAKETLEITDIKAFAGSRVIVSTPWSTVLKMYTGHSRVYLKQTPPMLALEADIIQILQNQFTIGVPDIIKHNQDLHCFLMQDAGVNLRTRLKKQFNTSLYCQAIYAFTTLQVETAKHTQDFFDLGVPDWRVEQLPTLFLQLLNQKKALAAEGVSENQIATLKNSLPILQLRCQTLSDFSIPQGICQPDFHDNNILIHPTTDKITLIDLGEIVISHPFFPLINLLQQAKKHHHLHESDVAYHNLKSACLKNFKESINGHGIDDVYAIAKPLALLFGALAFYRLMQACGVEHLHNYYGKGRLHTTLQQLQNTLQTDDAAQ